MLEFFAFLELDLLSVEEAFLRISGIRSATSLELTIVCSGCLFD